jgi:3-oxoacyl-[acyl-carrier-protein] synthase-3
LHNAQIDRTKIGALIHASVCRDHLEPATACRVHHELGLSQNCVIYDVSNACLGILNGMLQVANMIELGQIDAGLVVGSEGSRQLLETTIAQLNRDTTLTRQAIKLAVASLTIGSASCAVLLTHAKLSTTGNRLCAAVARANTEHHQLCHSGADEAAAAGMNPLMTTDSERLMAEGIATGVTTFRDFLSETGWTRADLQRTVCHQVGATHRKLMLESLQLPIENDFATLEWLGNTGSAALPVTMALAVEQNFIQPGQKVGLLGIGSGINCVMLGVEWQKSLHG